MNPGNYLFSSESVTEGHPDKVCDQISDAVLDEILKQDPQSRVACETMIAKNALIIAGEITTNAIIDYTDIAQDTLKEIGYSDAASGFDVENFDLISQITKQSPDIAMGVNNALETRDKDEKEVGAGDQGIMFGYATNETKEYMPIAILLAQKLALKLATVRKNKTLPYLRPDGKTQVTVEYKDGKPYKVRTVLIAAQHTEEVELEKIRKDIIEKVIKQVIPSNLLASDVRYLVNSTGRFVVGGPIGDVGLTGRKIIVDTYGGAAHHGGGAFSGKDPTKVDRSASYAARYVAKNIVAAHLADKCEIQLAYAIGVAKPLSIKVETFGTGKITYDKLIKIIDENFDLRPGAIIKHFNLRRPIYKQTAAYGHFGRDDLDLPWEKTDKVNSLKKSI